MVKFYRAAQAAGVKPIIGVDLRVREPGERAEPSTLVLLCQNEVGYRNLTRLVSRSYLEGQQHGRRDDRSQLARRRQPRRADRAVRRARRRSRSRAHQRPRRRGAQRAASAGSRCSAIATTSSCSARGREGEERYMHGALELAAELRRAGRRDQRRALHPRRGLRSARSARVHSRRRAARRSEAARRYSDRAVPEVAAADGGAVRGRARGDRQLGRDRASLQSRAEARQVRAAGVSGAVGNSATEDYLREEAQRGLATRLERLRSGAACAAHDRARGVRAAPRRPSSASSARWGSPATS